MDVDNMDVRNLFEYSQELRKRYLEQLATLPWEEVTKNRGGSFDSLRNIMLHTIDVEDRLVNGVIIGRTDWISRNPEDFHDIESIKERMMDVESKNKAYLKTVTTTELERKVEMRRPGTQSITLRVEDVLIASAVENIHHFGELIGLLWQMDIEPPHMGWIGYIQR